jgi:hypothetical protein
VAVFNVRGNEMNKGTILGAALVLAVIGLMLVRCTHVKAEKTQKQAAEAAVRQTKQAYRDAIREVLESDDYITRIVNEKASFKEWFQGLNSKSRKMVVANMKRIPLDACPDEFQAVYKSHIKAWESGDEHKIKATYIDVLTVAQVHGLYWNNKR